MTLEGAISFNETDIYTIYTMNSTSAGQYCVVLPKNTNGNYNMLVDLHMKSLFDEVNNGLKTKDVLVGEIASLYDGVKTKYSDAILVIPMFDETNYVNIINSNDKQKLFDEVKKIGAITSELYKKIVDGGIDKSRIDQKIIIIEKNDYDKKFVEWLTGQMPNFVSGVDVNEFNNINSNPFVDNTSDNNSNNIFGAPVDNVSNVTPNVVENVNPVPEVQNSNLLNEAPVNNESVVQTESSIVQPQVEIPNVFESQEQPIQQPTVVQNDTNIQPQPVTDTVSVEPKPVQSVELDKTVTFSPINESNNNVPGQSVQEQPQVQAAQNVTPVVENSVASENPKRKSNGFVNLVILLVILVGVTLVSIELGKFLYNTYGV